MSDIFDTELWEELIDASYSECIDFTYDSPFLVCNHKWKPIFLLSSTVYNCEFCDMKKEDLLT